MIRTKSGGIRVENFAILSTCNPSQGMDATNEVSVLFSEELKSVYVRLGTTFTQNGEVMVLQDVSCRYIVHEHDWDMVVKNGRIVCPYNLFEELINSTFGISTGILHCKVEGTPYYAITIPYLKKDVLKAHYDKYEIE